MVPAARSGLLQSGGSPSTLFVPFIAVSHGQNWYSQEELLVKAKLCIQGCWNPERVKQVPKSAFPPAGSGVSSDWRSWWMWVTTFPGCEESGTCSLHSQQTIFCEVSVQTMSPSLFCHSPAFGVRRGKFHHKKCVAPCTFFCPSTSKAVRNDFSSYPGGEIILQALGAITPHQRVDRGNSESILNLRWDIDSLVMDTFVLGGECWDVGMDANLAGFPLKKSTAGGC